MRQADWKLAALGALALASCFRSLDSLESFPCGNLDYDCPVGWQCEGGTCLKIPDAGVSDSDAGTDPRQCEQASDCNSVDLVCIAAGRGGSSCVTTCTGFSGGCGAGLDCKLIIDAQLQYVVPACTPSGTSTTACYNVNDCADGRTCVEGSDGLGHCLEICSVYHTQCTDAQLSCQPGSNTPSGWGYCQ